MNGRIVLPSNARTHRPRLPVAPKPKKAVAAKADYQAKAPAVVTSAVKSVLAAPALAYLPRSADDDDVRRKVARVQAEAQLPRLVSGLKQKDDILEKYQAQYGNGSPCQKILNITEFRLSKLGFRV